MGVSASRSSAYESQSVWRYQDSTTRTACRVLLLTLQTFRCRTTRISSDGTPLRTPVPRFCPSRSRRSPIYSQKSRVFPRRTLSYLSSRRTRRERHAFRSRGSHISASAAAHVESSVVSSTIANARSGRRRDGDSSARGGSGGERRAESCESTCRGSVGRERDE